MQMLTSILHHVPAQQAVTDLHGDLADEHLCTSAMHLLKSECTSTA